MSLAGNPACPPAPVRGRIADVTIEQLSLGAPLGEGASGDVFAAHMVSLSSLALLSNPCSEVIVVGGLLIPPLLAGGRGGGSEGI